MLTTQSCFGRLKREARGQHKSANVNFVRKSDQELEHKIERLWKIDAQPNSSKLETGSSKEYRLALMTMNQSKRLVDGHYQPALPWRLGAPDLDNNVKVAELRLPNLQRRFDKNPEVKRKHAEVIESYL